MVWPKFAYWLLLDEKHGVVRFSRGDSLAAINSVGSLYGRWIEGYKPSTDEWSEAAEEAEAEAAAAGARAEAADAAEGVAIIVQAEKLIELLKECK